MAQPRIIRFQTARWAAGLLVSLGLLLVPGLEAPRDRILSRLQDLLHVPLFAVMTVLLIRLFSARGGPVRGTALALAAAAGLGVAAERVQPWVGRTAEGGDILLGLAGSAIGAGVLWIRRVRAGITRAVLLGVVVLLLAGALVPLGTALVDRALARRQFPLLGSFECGAELGRWTANGCELRRTREGATDGRWALEARVTQQIEYAGLFLVDMPRDWRRATSLRADLFLAAPNAAQVWVRLDDQASRDYWTRFQKMILLKPGSNRVVFGRGEMGIASGGRPLDLEHVRSWGLFFDSAAVGDRLCVDRVALTLEEPE